MALSNLVASGIREYYIRMARQTDGAILHDFAIDVWKEGPAYVAYAPVLDISSCGCTVKEAKSRLMEAVSLFLEEVSSRKEFVREFTRIVSKHLSSLPAAEQDRRIRAALSKATSKQRAKNS